MQKFYIVFIVLTLFSVTVLAQVDTIPPTDQEKTMVGTAKKDTTYWTKALKVGANLTQAAFSDNWKAGGVNAIAYNTLLEANADYNRDRTTISLVADCQYGNFKNEGQGWRKSLDKIFLDAKFGYAFATEWSFYASLNFLSQFDKGYQFVKEANQLERQFLISQFLSPGYFTQSLGVEYKPVNYFFIRFGTGTLRQTIVIKNSDTTFNSPTRLRDLEYFKETKNYGVDFDKKIRTEIAFQAMVGFDKDIAKNINLKARYIGFVNYDKLSNPEQWDQRAELTLLAKINNLVNVSLTGLAIYDKDADDKFQISQALSLGLAYSLGDIKKYEK